MRIAICDDIKKEQEELVAAIHKYDPTRTPECFFCGADLLSAIKDAEAENKPFDIVFLDIYMPGENGVNIASDIQSIALRTSVVFVTTSRDHAVAAFSLQALHYLVKPVTSEGVAEVFRRLAEYQNRERPFATFSAGTQSIVITLEDISYVQSNGHDKQIVLNNGKTYRVTMTMDEIEQKLGNAFLKLDRSILINMDQIEIMGGNACLLKSGIKFDFTRRKKSSIRKEYDEYLFSKLEEGKERRR